MRIAFTLLLSALVVAGTVHGTESKSDLVLFARADYRFVVTACTAEPVGKERKMVHLVIAYDVPKAARFAVYGSRSETHPVMTDPLFWQEIESTPKGELKIEFESDGEPTAFFGGLWRGVGGGSPSGLVCDGAMVSLLLKIMPAFRHEK